MHIVQDGTTCRAHVTVPNIYLFTSSMQRVIFGTYMYMELQGYQDSMPTHT